MPRELHHLIAEMDAAWGAEDPAGAFAAHFADDGVLHDMTAAEAVHGQAAIAEAMRVFTGAFNPLSFESVLVADDGTTAVVEWTARGVHTGELDGIPATGRSIELRGVNLLTLTGEGKVAQERSFWDSGALLSQLGVL